MGSALPARSSTTARSKSIAFLSPCKPISSSSKPISSFSPRSRQLQGGASASAASSKSPALPLCLQARASTEGCLVDAVVSAFSFFALVSDFSLLAARPAAGSASRHLQFIAFAPGPGPLPFRSRQSGCIAGDHALILNDSYPCT